MLLLLLVFDRYPELKVPVIRLGKLGECCEIADPVDGGLAEFQRCYQRIAAVRSWRGCWFIEQLNSSAMDRNVEDAAIFDNKNYTTD